MFEIISYVQKVVNSRMRVVKFRIKTWMEMLSMTHMQWRIYDLFEGGGIECV